MTTPSGYTAVACTALCCGLTDPGTVGAELVGALRDTVRTSRHGVLVSTGCLLGAPCATRAVAPVVLVQPCDEERRPTSRAQVVGPLRTTEDVDALAAWLRAGDLHPHLLPGHLLDAARRAARHRGNTV